MDKLYWKISRGLYLGIVLCTILFSGSSIIEKHGHNSHFNQGHTHSGLHRLMAQGNPYIVKDITIHGAIIVSDHFKEANFDVVGNETLPSRSNDNGDHDEIKKLAARTNNYLLLQSQLPFTLTKWSAVVTGPCPQYPNGHKGERGLVWAHYRVWRDFVYFDPDVSSAVDKNISSVEKGNAVSSSADGVYVAFSNGTLVKNQTPYKEEDILVIFEDDAMSVIDNTNITIIEEFSDMKVDILYLGWCEGRTARPVPLCSHAYAITRKAARKLVHYWEPCGRAVDEQFVILVKNGWLSYRRAHPYSYKELKKDYSPHGDKTFGIFRQCKSQCGSVNGH